MDLMTDIVVDPSASSRLDPPYGLVVQESQIAPWYGQLGLGTQYLLPDTVGNLVGAGVLERVVP